METATIKTYMEKVNKRKMIQPKQEKKSTLRMNLEILEEEQQPVHLFDHSHSNDQSHHHDNHHEEKDIDEEIDMIIDLDDIELPDMNVFVTINKNYRKGKKNDDFFYCFDCDDSDSEE